MQTNSQCEQEGKTPPKEKCVSGPGGRRTEGRMVADLAGAFREMRVALTTDLSGIHPSQWNIAIPTRSWWTVKDTVAMLSGFAGALIEGRWTEDYSDSWADHEI